MSSRVPTFGPATRTGAQKKCSGLAQYKNKKFSLWKARSIGVSGGRGPLDPLGFPVFIWAIIGADVADDNGVSWELT